VRWLADECVAAPLVARLREAGHDVAYMAEIAPATADPDVLARSHDDGRLLLTEDKDFGELVVRWNRPVPGLVLLRIDPEKNLLKSARLDAAIGTFGERLYGRYTVVEEARFRSRPLHSPGRET
jgi:predicted nuclease of predicted toxin-antitoxin system